MKKRLNKRQEGGFQSLAASSPYLIALGSGILMGMTVAPVGAWPLAWIALAPLWVLVVNSTKQEHFLFPAPLPLIALLWGVGYHGLALKWITGIHPMTWMGVPWLASLAIALFCWAFITLWGAALVAVWATCLAVVSRGVGVVARILIGVAFWCGLESLWSLGALWWTSLSYTQSPYNLAILHLGQISGPSTVTAAVVAVNGLIAEAWCKRWQAGCPPHRWMAGRMPAPQMDGRQDARPIDKSDSSAPLWFFLHQAYFHTAIVLLIGLHVVGFVLYSQPLIEPLTASLKVGIIQGNVPNEIKLYPEGFRRAIEGYTTGYETLASQGVDAVLTPEGALPFLWSDVMRSSFYSAVLEKGVVAWLGAFGERGSSITNSLFTLTGIGEIFSRYDKAKLVPLGEYIPFEQFLGGIVDRLSPLEAHQVAGQPNQLFDTPFGRAIASICYESAFAEHFRRQAAAGGQFILSAANNAHYSSAMPAQHHAQDVMRAIETERWAVRATNTGYSGIVDPRGRTQWLSRLNTYELHTATIYKRQTKTLYVQWGEWLTPLLLVSGAIAWLINITTR